MKVRWKLFNLQNNQSFKNMLYNCNETQIYCVGTQTYCVGLGLTVWDLGTESCEVSTLLWTWNVRLLHSNATDSG